MHASKQSRGNYPNDDIDQFIEGLEDLRGNALCKEDSKDDYEYYLRKLNVE